jgi:YVTN family beta-propeller protein
VYVADYGTKQLSVIDTANGNAVTNVAVGTNPRAVAVNPATNTIYVANYSDGTVSVVNGLTLATTLVTVGANPIAIAVNPVLNKVYVANYGSASGTGNITIIDPVNGNATTAANISNCSKPSSVAVNVNTSFVYTACFGGNELGVVNAASSNSTSTSGSAGSNPQLLDINPLTNRIFVTDSSATGAVSVVDGVSKSGSTASGLNLPAGVAADSITDKAYVAVSGATANNVLILTPQPDLTFPLAIAIVGTTDSNTQANSNLFQTASTTPSFTVTVTPQFSSAQAYTALMPANLPASAILYQIDGGAATWTPVSGGVTKNGITTFAVTLTTPLTLGLHTIYAFASYGDTAAESASNGAGEAAVVSNTAGTQFSVAQPATTTTLTAPSTSVVAGSTQTYTATIAPSAASLYVSFSDTYNGITTAIGTVAVSAGAAQQPYTVTGVGTHTITASYSGDATYAASQGSLSVQVNSPDPTRTTVSVSNATAPYNTSVTIRRLWSIRQTRVRCLLAL